MVTSPSTVTDWTTAASPTTRVGPGVARLQLHGGGGRDAQRARHAAERLDAPQHVLGDGRIAHGRKGVDHEHLPAGLRSAREPRGDEARAVVERHLQAQAPSGDPDRLSRGDLLPTDHGHRRAGRRGGHRREHPGLAFVGWVFGPAGQRERAGRERGALDVGGDRGCLLHELVDYLFLAEREVTVRGSGAAPASTASSSPSA